MEKVLIVDDDSEMRSLLSDIVRLEGYEPIAADNGKQALEIVKMHSPGVVLLDIRLPEMDGMQVLEEIKKLNKNLIVIMITGYGDFKDAVQSIKCGAFNYITKPVRNSEIVDIIKEAFLLRQSGNNEYQVSPREKEVLVWLKEGKSSRDMAMLLNISERTVNFHISNIMHKLDAVSRTHAVAIAVEKGLVAPV